MEPTQRSPIPTPDDTPSRKRFKCNMCQRQFSRRKHLQRHQSIHYGHKPFHCTVCSYACRRRDLLNRHIRLSHPKEAPLGRKGGQQSPASDDQPSAHETTQDSPLRHAPSNTYSPARQADGDVQTTQNIPGVSQPLGQIENLNDIPPYVGSNGVPPHVPLIDADVDSQYFTFNYLDSVALPYFIEQAVFPELPLNHPFFESPPLTAENPVPSTPGALLQEQANPNPLVGPSDVGRHHVHLAPFLRISHDDWLWLSAEVARFSSVLPTHYDLPSRHAISRYLHGFMNGFHPHFPIIHPQSLTLREMAPELTLALAAVGSQYCLESHQGLKLWPLARSIAMEQLRLRDANEDEKIQTRPESKRLSAVKSVLERITGTDGQTLDSATDASAASHAAIETIQAFFYLMAMATWAGEHRSLVRQAIGTQSILAMLVRQHGLFEGSASAEPQTWKSWARVESARRTKLIIFSFFNLHTVTFNLPSPLMIADVHLRLPCTESEWKAPDADTWVAVHQRSQPAPLFQDCMAELLQNKTGIPACSSLGSHVLVHALLQQIFSARQAMQLESMMEKTSSGLCHTLRQALKKWQTAWEVNPESSLSPLDKHGPIAFNSTALFHLAYVRLVIDIGPARSLLEQDHVQIANRLKQQPKLPRGPMLVLAARHATAALCPPVQMGVYFVGRVPNWSVMHAVCALEYAYILNQFLQATTSPELEYPLNTEEQALLTVLKDTLREVEAATPDGNPRIVDTMPQVLGAKAVRAWGLILEGMRTWNAVELITRALFAYADSLEDGACQ